MLERTGCVHIVSGINTYLLSIQSCHVGHFRIEMHVGHQRYRTACRTYTGVDVPQVLGLTHPLGRQTYIISSGFGNA